MTLETVSVYHRNRGSWSRREVSFNSPCRRSWASFCSVSAIEDGRRSAADALSLVEFYGGQLDITQVRYSSPKLIAGAIKVLTPTKSRSPVTMPGTQSRNASGTNYPADGVVADPKSESWLNKENLRSIVRKGSLFGNLKRVTLLGSCGLAGLAYSRRKYLVTPVSRTPSQELVKDVYDEQQQIANVLQKQMQQSPVGGHSFADRLQDCPWIEKYQPQSLKSFICQSQTAVYLQNLISHGNCPNIIFSGSPGSGKRALIRAMLRDVLGVEVSRVRNANKSFSVQGGRLPNFLVPVLTSAYHTEIDVSSIGDFAEELLPTIIADMSVHAFRQSPAYVTDIYKVLVLHQADRLSTDAQLILRRCMNLYGDACKFILSYSPDPQLGDYHVLEELQSSFHYINVATPTVDEIVKVLQYITHQESLELPVSLAMRIAVQSKQNLKQAITILEACKAQQYPFVDDQMVQLGYWQREIVKIAEDIVSHPTPKQLFIIRPKLQAMLTNSVPAALILQELQEELIENFQEVDEKLGKEICHWAKHFDSKLTAGPETIYQLESFVAKVMSIYKKYLNAREQQWITMVALAPSEYIS